jgi:uncharacterized protein (TIGR02145 family)
MKHRFIDPLIIFIVFLSALTILISCKKEKEEQETSGVTAVTSSATNIGQGWATLNGSVNADNKLCSISFEYDTATTYKYAISGIPDKVSGDTTKSIWVNLTGLHPNTEYYFRLKAEYSGETKYGSDMSFTTSSVSKTNIKFNPDLVYGSVADIDGNTYKTIQIGTRTWMAENLKVTRYNDGTVIPFVLSASVWASLSAPGYCWYNNDSVAYGAMYNWYAVTSNELCPDGWHVPSDEEWAVMISYLGGEDISGGKLKESGTSHWNVPNFEATNGSGFTALPGGYRSTYGIYNSLRQKGYWWSSTEFSSGQAFYRIIGYNFSNISRSNTSKVTGLSIRCIRNN